MIKTENIETFNWQGAIRGMRNPLNSWDKSDSAFIGDINFQSFIGENDLQLMKKLYKAGSEHRKYLRQIFVSMDITAPLYWWKEFDTYKISTTSNSCSTMHTIHKKEFTFDDFSYEHLNEHFIHGLETIILDLNYARRRYLETKDKECWWQMIQILPTSYNQKRTVTMNYENVISMIKQRTGHKLDEWNDFIEVLKQLPYIKEITAEV